MRSFWVRFALASLGSLGTANELFRFENWSFPSGRTELQAKDVYNIPMDQDDVIPADDPSIDEDLVRALTDQYVDQETTAQLED